MPGSWGSATRSEPISSPWLLIPVATIPSDLGVTTSYRAGGPSPTDEATGIRQATASQGRGRMEYLASAVVGSDRSGLIAP